MPSGAVRLAESGICTYRQIDYWLRSGYVVLAGPGNGSGTFRVLTDAEVEGVKAVAAAFALRGSILGEIKSGKIFADACREATS